MTFPLSLVDQGFLLTAFPIVSASENLGKLPVLFAKQHAAGLFGGGQRLVAAEVEDELGGPEVM